MIPKSMMKKIKMSSIQGPKGAATRYHKRGRPLRYLLQSEIEEAMANTKSNIAASKWCKVSFTTYKKYASNYFDSDGKSLYEKHKNQTGRGISQFREGHHGNQYPLEDLLEGKHPEYPTWKLLKRLIKHKVKDECCEICNFQENRPGDGKVPLILGFNDRNKKHRALDNLIVMCYNCFFLHQGKLAGGKDAPYPRKNSTLLKHENLDEEDYDMLRNL